MTDADNKLALQNAILEWQKKYGVRDGDPLLASLELFQIYLTNASDAKKHEGSVPTFVEFRESMEFLDRRCKQVAKLAQELIEALRKSSFAKRSSNNGILFATSRSHLHSTPPAKPPPPKDLSLFRFARPLTDVAASKQTGLWPPPHLAKTDDVAASLHFAATSEWGKQFVNRIRFALISMNGRIASE